MTSPSLAIPACFQPDLLTPRGIEIINEVIFPIESASEGQAVSLSLQFSSIDNWADSFQSAHVLVRTATGFRWSPSAGFGDGLYPRGMFREISDGILQGLTAELDIDEEDDFDLLLCSGVAIISKSEWESRVTSFDFEDELDEAQAIIDYEMMAVLPHDQSAHGRLMATPAIARLPALVAASARQNCNFPSFTVALED